MNETLPLFDVSEFSDQGKAQRASGQRSTTFRYIGSKARIARDIAAFIGGPGRGRFVDGFCGTGAVSEAMADAGWKITLNDTLQSAVCMSAARLYAATQVPFSKFGGYGAAIDRLNQIAGKKGMFWREYSPASGRNGKDERRYFTEDNAAKIDAIRQAIEKWSEHKEISPEEKILLIADLLGAINRVANIAGTYGCFLTKWSKAALDPLELRPRTLRKKAVEVESCIGDAKKLVVRKQDVVYLDPPYTKRQYAAYYHILETAAAGDAPDVTGVTGLRPWKALASDYCYKSRALRALTELVGGLQAERIILSYSSEGHVEIDALTSALVAIGKVEVTELGRIGRYRPNRAAVVAGGSVNEYLISIYRPQTKPSTINPP